MLTLTAAPARLPPGERIYAIGDVHGCVHRLAALHAAIREDSTARAPATTTLLYLGDYVDRGLDSALVLDMLGEPPALPGAARVLLRGNHEAMMLDALATDAPEGKLRVWMQNGGIETLGSYDTDPGDAGWRARVPPAHLVLLRGTGISHRAGGYLFAHAGIRPNVPLDRQNPHDLLWIREPFLSWKGAAQEAVVVHGHTPAPKPEVRPHRIGIDTGACFGGALTCLVLENDRMGFLAR